jgi:hypothetical protein
LYALEDEKEPVLCRSESSTPPQSTTPTKSMSELHIKDTNSSRKELFMEQLRLRNELQLAKQEKQQAKKIAIMEQSRLRNNGIPQVKPTGPPQVKTIPSSLFEPKRQTNMLQFVRKDLSNESIISQQQKPQAAQQLQAPQQQYTSQQLHARQLQTLQQPIDHTQSTSHHHQSASSMQPTPHHQSITPMRPIPHHQAKPTSDDELMIDEEMTNRNVCIGMINTEIVINKLPLMLTRDDQFEIVTLESEGRVKDNNYCKSFYKKLSFGN